MSSHFSNLLGIEREKQIHQLQISIERIADAIDRFNDQLAAAGYPTAPISIRHQGKESKAFFGQTSVALDLQSLMLLHKMDRFRICYPDPHERRAA